MQDQLFQRDNCLNTPNFGFFLSLFSRFLALADDYYIIQHLEKATGPFFFQVTFTVIKKNYLSFQNNEFLKKPQRNAVWTKNVKQKLSLFLLWTKNNDYEGIEKSKSQVKKKTKTK